MSTDDEEAMLRSVALQNARSIMQARKRAEDDLRRVEQDLRESEHQLRAIADAAPVLISYIDAEERYRFVNRQYEKWFEQPIEGMLGRHMRDVLGEAAYEFLRPYTARALAGERVQFESEIPYARGKPRYIEASYVPDVSEDHTVRGFYAVVADITGRKQTERALVERTRDLEILNDTGTGIASELDLQTLVQKVTDSATELTGAKFGAFFYNVTDASGESFLLYTLSGAPREAFEHFGLPRNTPVFETTFRGVGIIRSADITTDPRYGQLPPHHGMPRGHLPVRSYLAVPVKSRSGEVIGGLFFGHPEPDVFTERAERLVGGMAAQAGIAIDNARLYDAAQKASEERRGLLESERAARSAAERLSEIKDEFLATLSHELRTPLNAIVGWAEVLRRGPKTEADLAKGLETIERSARVQAQLIDDLLDMSRIASGKMRLDVQPIRPSSFIQAAVETLKPSAEAKGVVLTTVLDPGAGPISGDPNRLQQVVWNLLSNAIKFTPRGGKVQILLERVNSHIEISVADTGIGIKPEFADHLFERFRQADATASRNYGGLGLGLSIVKQLVELHGGAIHVASPGEGLGTTVVVRLPLTVVHRAGSDAGYAGPGAEETAVAAYLSTDLSGVRVLVVDDQDDACDLIRRLLEDCGAVVTTACSAEEALPLVHGERPDVLISDIGMPGQDGYRVPRQRPRARSGGRRPGPGDCPHGVRALGRSHARPARRIPRARLEARGSRGARSHGRECRGPDSRATVARAASGSSFPSEERLLHCSTSSGL